MTEHERFRRAIYFERPDYIPIHCGFTGGCWDVYDHNQMYDLMESHPILFPDFVRPDAAYRPVFSSQCKAGVPYKDDFGYIWNTSRDSISGVVTEHPLENWEAFKTYRMPDAAVSTGIGPIDMEKEKASANADRKAGKWVNRGL